MYSVSEKPLSKGKRAGYVLLCLGAAGLLCAYIFTVPHRDTPPVVSVSVDSGRAGVPSGYPAPPGAERSGELEPAVADTPLPNIPTKADSGLQEAELEHLGEVFMNSLYPLFQYDFPLDNEGRSAIDVFVASMPQGLSGDDLDTVSNMIETGLASPEAGDLAFIITHLYRLEQEEARITRQRGPVATMADQIAVQEQLSQLRDQWFGPELSTLLFSGAEDAQAPENPTQSENPPNATAAEELPELQARAKSELAAIERAWEQRYQMFLAEKQVIERAGLDQAEKARQIETLMRQHYAAKELKAAKAFDQSREQR